MIFYTGFVILKRLFSKRLGTGKKNKNKPFTETRRLVMIPSFESQYFTFFLIEEDNLSASHSPTLSLTFFKSRQIRKHFQ